MTRLPRPGLAVLTLLAFLTGCTSSVLYAPTTLTPASAAFPGSYVVETTYDTAGMRIPELEDAILRALNDSHSAAAVFDARRLDVSVAQTAAVHVGFHIRTYRVSEDDPPPGGIAVVVLGSLLIVPFAFLGVPRIQSEYWVEYEMTVRSLAGLPLTILPTSGGGQPVYDISSVAPLFRRSYRVLVHAGRNWIRSEMGGGEDRQRHWYAVTDQLGIRMVNEVLPDLDAIARAPR